MLHGHFRPALPHTALVALMTLLPVSQAVSETTPPPTPQGICGPGSNPEPADGLQGRRYSDSSDGDLANDITCNTERVGHYTFMSANYEPNTIGTVGGFKTHRYVDKAGNDCAYYDTTLLSPTNVFDGEAGVNVLDMSDPTNPVLTARLTTPAMMSPHESLVLSQERGLLAAVLGNLALGPGVVDVYSLEPDCRNPVLQSSAPIGVFGHESGMTLDGNIFFSASPATPTITAVDLTNPMAPRPIWTGEYCVHGLTLNADGSRAYLAHTPCEGDVSGFDESGMLILDMTEVTAAAGDTSRWSNPFPGQKDPTGQTSEPQAPVVGRVTWDLVTIPQNAIPVTIDGKPYVIEIDEFSNNQRGGTTAGHGSRVGAGRIIDISDETNPVVISDLRLEVHQPENRAAIANDPGAQPAPQGYAGHYCAVPRTEDPVIVACGMIVSGMRIFNITDPYNPVEVAYFNAAIPDRVTPYFEPSNWVMAAPAFVPERKEIWYSDGFSGFYAIRVTNDAWPDLEEETDAGQGKSKGKKKGKDKNRDKRGQ